MKMDLPCVGLERYGGKITVDVKGIILLSYTIAKYEYALFCVVIFCHISTIGDKNKWQKWKEGTSFIIVFLPHINVKLQVSNLTLTFNIDSGGFWDVLVDLHLIFLSLVCRLPMKLCENLKL